MVPWLLEILRTGTVTTRFPRGPVPNTGPFRGYLRADSARGCADCRRCVGTCPSPALGWKNNGLSVDQAACLRCNLCVAACPEGNLSFSPSPLGAVRHRDALRKPMASTPPPPPAASKVLRRSLALRTVDAGSCGACEAEIQALANPFYDLTRLGLSFTPTPKHADTLLVTGPVTAGMAAPLDAALEAMPEPRLVIAVGACATGGGPFPTSAFSHGGLDTRLTPCVYVPGCPPHPLAILEGILLALGRAEESLPTKEAAG